MKRTPVIFFLGLFVILTVSAQTYRANWQSIDSRPVPAWFQDAKVGILRRLSSDALTGFSRDLERLSQRLPAMARRCRKPEELQVIGRCRVNVLCDVRYVQQQNRARL